MIFIAQEHGLGWVYEREEDYDAAIIPLRLGANPTAAERAERMSDIAERQKVQPLRRVSITKLQFSKYTDWV